MQSNIIEILWTFDKFPEQNKHSEIQEIRSVCLTFLHTLSESYVFVNAQFLLSISFSY